MYPSLCAKRDKKGRVICTFCGNKYGPNEIAEWHAAQGTVTCCRLCAPNLITFFGDASPLHLDSRSSRPLDVAEQTWREAYGIYIRSVAVRIEKALKDAR